MIKFDVWSRNPSKFGVPQWKAEFFTHCFYFSSRPEEEKEAALHQQQIIFGGGDVEIDQEETDLPGYPIFHQTTFTEIPQHYDDSSDISVLYTYHPFTPIEQYVLAAVCDQPIIAIAHHAAPNPMLQSNTLHIDIQAGPSKITFWLTGYYNPEQQKMDLRFGVRMYPFANPNYQQVDGLMPYPYRDSGIWPGATLSQLSLRHGTKPLLLYGDKVHTTQFRFVSNHGEGQTQTNTIYPDLNEQRQVVLFWATKDNTGRQETIAILP